MGKPLVPAIDVDPTQPQAWILYSLNTYAKTDDLLRQQLLRYHVHVRDGQRRILYALWLRDRLRENSASDLRQMERDWTPVVDDREQALRDQALITTVRKATEYAPRFRKLSAASDALWLRTIQLLAARHMRSRVRQYFHERCA